MRKISDRAGLWLAFFVLLAGAAACQSTPHSESRSEAARPKSEPARASTRQANDADRYDLARDEQRGGHTLDKHVGRTDAELRERLDRERDISAASTWTDRATAERTVAAALRANRKSIAGWLVAIRGLTLRCTSMPDKRLAEACGTASLRSFRPRPRWSY